MIKNRVIVKGKIRVMVLFVMIIPGDTERWRFQQQGNENEEKMKDFLLQYFPFKNQGDTQYWSNVDLIKYRLQLYSE